MKLVAQIAPDGVGVFDLKGELGERPLEWKECISYCTGVLTAEQRARFRQIAEETLGYIQAKFPDRPMTLEIRMDTL